MAVIIAAACATNAAAQQYPNKPVRIMLGFAPGGAIDFVARLIGKRISDSIGQPVVIENRVGAGSALATDAVAKSPADGYTLLMSSSSSTTLPALRKLPFDMERDLTPVSLVATGATLLLVHPSVPAHNVKELIALARAHPGELSYGSSGTGTVTHLMGEQFKLMAKVDILHVPYKASQESAVATASGEVAMGFFDATSAMPLIDTGKLRALATVGSKRLASMPSLPTISESGLPGYDYSIWYGIFAPAAVPKDIIARLNALIVREGNSSEVKAVLGKQGLEATTSTPEEFAARFHRDLEMNAKLIKLAGVKE
jgi:tripartite-type tricarboxylate transporter receptor subunit TctC